MNTPIDFWFDFSSPYSYIANEWIDAIAARHGRTVQRARDTRRVAGDRDEEDRQVHGRRGHGRDHHLQRRGSARAARPRGRAVRRPARRARTRARRRDPGRVPRPARDARVLGRPRVALPQAGVQPPRDALRAVLRRGLAIGTRDQDDAGDGHRRRRPHRRRVRGLEEVGRAGGRAQAQAGAMITLHHCLNARSFRPLWMLEEIGLPYELKVWPFPPRAHDKRYLSVNPLGTVPAFVDGDTFMTESAAICQYLAARHSPRALDVAPDEADYGAYLNFLHQGEATLTFPLALVLRYAHFEPAERRQPQVADDYAKWFIARTRMVAARVADRDYVCAGRFTAADVAVGYALMLGEIVGLHGGYAPALLAYWQRLRERPAD